MTFGRDEDKAIKDIPEGYLSQPIGLPSLRCRNRRDRGASKHLLFARTSVIANRCPNSRGRNLLLPPLPDENGREPRCKKHARSLGRNGW